MEILIPIIIWGGILGGVIYYAIRRWRLKDREDFEKRDN